jgi:hypothetical protein
VDNGGSLRAIGGVGCNDLGGDTRGDGANGTGSESSDRETHFDMGNIENRLKIKVVKRMWFKRM